MVLSRGLPSATESSPRGFSTRLSPWRSCFAAHPPARFTPSRGQPIVRASRAPQTWVECGPIPSVASRRESAEPVCELSARAILSVEVPGRLHPVVCRPELTRFTPGLQAGILSLFEDSNRQKYLLIPLTRFSRINETRRSSAGVSSNTSRSYYGPRFGR